MEHFFHGIKGWFNFSDIYSEMVQRVNTGHFVEVGVFLGKSTSFLGVEIINSGKKIRLDVVDTFQGTPNSLALTNNMLDKFRVNIKPIEHIVNIVALPSIEAVRLYKDSSLDFVFIDANHDYTYVSEDIDAWLPKVKKGGYLGGHDYGGKFPGVIQAVDERFGNNKNIRRTSWLVKI